MTSLQAILLGIVQGLTEFLPISSSGHLVITEKLLHVQTNTLLLVTCLHVGTLVAVTFAMRREVVHLLRHPWSREALLIAAALVPTAAIGVVFEDVFEKVFDSGSTLGFEFVITGVILWWMDGYRNGAKTESTLRIRDAVWIGTFQGIALFPALSRSGMTIAAGLWRGMNRQAAARFSFLLSIPAIFGATLVEAEDLWEHPLHTAIAWTPLLLGTLAALIAGYLSVHWTLWWLQHAKMRLFAMYAWALAAFVLVDQFVFHVWFSSPITW